MAKKLISLNPSPAEFWLPFFYAIHFNFVPFHIIMYYSNHAHDDDDDDYGICTNWPNRFD